MYALSSHFCDYGKSLIMLLGVVTVSGWHTALHGTLFLEFHLAHRSDIADKGRSEQPKSHTFVRWIVFRGTEGFLSFGRRVGGHQIKLEEYLSQLPALEKVVFESWHGDTWLGTAEDDWTRSLLDPGQQLCEND